MSSNRGLEPVLFGAVTAAVIEGMFMIDWRHWITYVAGMECSSLVFLTLYLMQEQLELEGCYRVLVSRSILGREKGPICYCELCLLLL